MKGGGHGAFGESWARSGALATGFDGLAVRLTGRAARSAEAAQKRRSSKRRNTRKRPWQPLRRRAD
jgi:hypothetical protein